jgi:hypothetical protein
MHNRATASLLHRFRGGLRKKELSFEDGVERTPLSKAVMRVFQPRTRRIPREFLQLQSPTPWTIAAGKNQLTLAV